jgi:hypothetical protein
MTESEGNVGSLAHGLSDQVRRVALRKYLRPAMEEGRVQVSVAARSLMDDLRATGFPANNWHQVCTAIQAKRFLRDNGLEIERVDGPPSKTSSTVVVHFRLPEGPGAYRNAMHEEVEVTAEETPEEWAHRLTERLRGLLKDEIQSMGGTEAFMRWVRSDEGDGQ